MQNTPSEQTSLRVVPEEHEDIIRMFPKRMPLNNVTAMIRKEAIDQAGGSCRNTESAKKRYQKIY